MRVGVLALQGDVPEHRAAFSKLVGSPAVRFVRRPADLVALEALVMPGGESTTISRLLSETGLDEAIAVRVRAGLPVLATCAGLILIARELEPSPGGRDPPTLGLLDVRVRRNDYGGQRESFEAPLSIDGLAGAPFPGVFIRAPRIVAVGREVRPIARLGEQVVGVRSGAIWGFTFHPELSGDTRLFAAFLRGADATHQSTRIATARATRVRTTPTAAHRE